MADFKLESWEHEPLWLKLLTPFLKKKRFPTLPSQPKPGQWYRIYPEGCVDANGERTYANFQLGTENKLLVYFSGGGLSWNEYTAARQESLYSKNPSEGFYMVHVDLFTDLRMNTGIFENQPRNPFQNWSKLVFNYNTGDFHAGDGDFPYRALDGSQRVVHHHGFRNYQAVMQITKRLVSAPDCLLVTGCSGGAFGAALVADDLAEQYPACENITCLADSGFFRLSDWHGIAKDVWHAPQKIVERIHSDNIMLDALTSLHQKHGERLKCLFSSSVRDGFLGRMMQYVESGTFSFSNAGGDLCYRELQQFIDELRAAVPTVGLYFFDVPDKKQKGLDLTIHCIIGGEFAYSYQQSGMSVIQWLEKAVQGDVRQIGLPLLHREES